MLEFKGQGHTSVQVCGGKGIHVDTGASKSLFLFILLLFSCSGATGRVLDLRSTGRGFKSYCGQKLRNNLGQFVHTYLSLSPSSIT